ncbi:Type II secretory pathway component PulC-like protein [Candidatus Magnetoovum chiemensis]|nr:Type II secretory pathway component PulC-like protein [Candidatus Magnetoovum chiemensis]
MKTLERAVKIAGFVLNKKLLFVINLSFSIFLIILTMALIRNVISFKMSSFNIDDDKALFDTAGGELKKDLNDYADAVTKNPFGVADAVFSPLTVKTDAAKSDNNKADVKLLGTISGNMGTGYAILKDNKGKQEMFKINEKAFSLGTLTGVAIDSITIDDELKIYIEDIYKYGTETQKTASIASAASSPKSREAIHNTLDSADISEHIRPISDTSYEVDSDMVQNAIANPRNLMTDARLQPRYINGKQEGFIMKEIKKDGIYAYLGLKNDDVLLRINSYDLTDPETALQAFSALRGVNAIELNIIRDNANLTLDYQIK